MEYKRIKHLNKDVSKFVFGTPSLNVYDEDASFKMLDEVYSRGINTFDVAALYSDGVAEEVLGKWINERGLFEKTTILTKCAHPSKIRNRVTSYDIMSDMADSFARLKVPYIDIYLLHRDDLSVPVGIVMDTLNRLYEQGKIKVFGGSNWTHQRIEEANEYAYKFGMEPMRASSPSFGLARQIASPWGDDCISIACDKDALKYYTENQMPVFAYSSLGQGLLSGKYKSDNIDTSLFSEGIMKGYYHPENIERLRRTEIIAKKYDASVSQIVLAWIFSRELNVFSVMGASKLKHLEQNIAVLDINLTNEESKWLNLEID